MSFRLAMLLTERQEFREGFWETVLGVLANLHTLTFT